MKGEEAPLPLPLVADARWSCSKRGGVALGSFGGSERTLFAAGRISDGRISDQPADSAAISLVMIARARTVPRSIE